MILDKETDYARRFIKHTFKNAWPESMDSACRALANDGKTVAQIAAALNKTKGSVIGFCYRKKINLARSRRKGPKAEKPLRIAKIIPECICESPLAVSFSHCQFLYGEARARNFCTSRATHGAWCEDHRRKVYERNK